MLRRRLPGSGGASGAAMVDLADIGRWRVGVSRRLGPDGWREIARGEGNSAGAWPCLANRLILVGAPVTHNALLVEHWIAVAPPLGNRPQTRSWQAPQPAYVGSTPYGSGTIATSEFAVRPRYDALSRFGLPQ